MSTFRERLEAAVQAWSKENDENPEHARSYMEAGARAALLLAAEEVRERSKECMDLYHDMCVSQDLGAADEARNIADELRARAKEIE